ncbi:hypothetical protein HDU97_000157 [Phlyctochytrium planicorne]|nr:hypothetical protein HDU97_000157 [Phlyctochytrium planicorne]
MASKVGLIHIKYEKGEGGFKASRHWSVRTLVLQDGHLMVFPKKTDESAKKSKAITNLDLLLSKTYVLERYKERSNPKCMFRLTLPSKASFLFECPTEHEAKNWVECINAEAETACREKIMVLESELRAIRVEMSKTAGGFLQPPVIGKPLCLQKQKIVARLSHEAEAKEAHIHDLRGQLKVLTWDMCDDNVGVVGGAGRHTRVSSWDSAASSYYSCTSSELGGSSNAYSAGGRSTHSISARSISGYQSRPKIAELYNRPSSGNWGNSVTKQVDPARLSTMTVVDPNGFDRVSQWVPSQQSRLSLRNSGEFESSDPKAASILTPVDREAGGKEASKHIRG